MSDYKPFINKKLKAELKKQAAESGECSLSEVVVRDMGGQYPFLNVGRRDLRMLTKTVFSSMKYPVVVVKGTPCKYVGCSRTEAEKILQRVLYRPQSLDGVREIFSGLKVCLGMLRAVGKASGAIDKFGSMIRELLRLILNIITNEFNGPIDVIRSCIDLYCVVTEVKKVFVPESLDGLILACTSLLMPPSLIEILKRLMLFSNVKILDEQNVITNSLEIFFSFVDKLIEDLVWIPQGLKQMLKYVGFLSSKRSIVVDTDRLLKEWNSNKSLLFNPFFQDRVDVLAKKWEDRDVLDWCRRSGSVEILRKRFENCSKALSNIRHTNRIEPVCIVLEGPPGTRKGVVMSQIVDLMRKPTYTHSVKSVCDGKDFYDTYNNEEVFVMDDVGQQGLSQWRTIINMVASVQYKLDCADCSLKDTKVFSSEIILLTTNHFSTIHGLTKQDSISDIEALWRRGIVLDFHNVKPVGSVLHGEIVVKTYDSSFKQFKEGLPPEIVDYCRRHSIECPKTRFSASDDVARSVQILKLIEIGKRVKKEHFGQNRTLQDKRDEIYELLETELMADAESLLDWIPEVLSSLLTDIIELAVDNWAVVALGLCLLLVTYKALCPKGSNFVAEMKELVGPYDVSSPGQRATSLQKNVFFATISQDQSVSECCAVASGRSVILPNHSVASDNGFLTLVTDRENTVVDHLAYEVVYRNDLEDVCVVALPRNYPSPFKDISKYFSEEKERLTLSLVTPCGVVGLQSLRKKPTSGVYPVRHRTIPFDEENSVQYALHKNGLCGSVLVDEVGGILGIHVAGDDISNTGVSLLWSKSLRGNLKEVLARGKSIVNVDWKEVPGQSVLKLDMKGEQYLSGKSKMVPTELFGVFPVEREPADLLKYGRHTVKDIAKKAFTPVCEVPVMHLEFARKTIDAMVQEFGDLADEHVVNGSEMLAPLNKDSSNGYKIPAGKELYVDFAKGEILPHALEKMENLERDVKNGSVNIEDHLWFECLKDEVRDSRKDRVPRSFRVSTIYNQLWMKRLTGEFVTNILQQRKFNGICVGINPFTEWQDLYDELLSCNKRWDVDFEKWDGSMLPQVQHLVAEVLKSKYKGSHPEMLDFLLQGMQTTPVVINDDVIITTHSMPSGSFLTAILNSLINRCYTAMWYASIVPNPSTVKYFSEVVDKVYGDDKLVGIRSNNPKLTARTMANYFESIGLKVTTARKTKVEVETMDMDELSFLKRTFKFHSVIGRIMCPLSLTTLKSGLSWYNVDSDEDVVIRDKICNFQRELYLHGRSVFEEGVAVLENFCKLKGVPFIKLPEAYIISLYKSPEECDALGKLLLSHYV